MDEPLICPDCGGVIGATEATDAGKPCTCFDYGKSIGAKAADATADDALNSAPPGPEAVGEDPSGLTGTGVAKLCIKCGVDVAGKKRIHDHRGYLCYDCAKEERRAERGDRVRCASCSRWAAPHAITEYEGMKICDQCLHERQQVALKSFKKLGIKTNQVRHERRQLYTLLAVAGFLLLIILLRKLRLLPDMLG